MAADKREKANENKIKRMPDTKKSQRPTTQRSANVGASMNIREQTPSRRRSAKEAKRIDPKLPEIRRSAKRAQGYKIKKKKKKIGRAAIAYTVLFVFVFLVVAGVFSLGFYVSLIQRDAPEFDSLKLKMCLEHEAEELKAVSVDTEKYIRNGVLYVNMSAIAEEFGFIVTGDYKQLRFITDEKLGEDVCFVIGTPFAEINGERVRLNGAVTKNDGSVFVPAEVFTEYVNGIEITLDEEKAVISILRDTERNEAGHFVESDVSFKLKEVTDSASISELDLSDEIKARCYFPTLPPDMVTPN